jgi:hypothetical protein
MICGFFVVSPVPVISSSGAPARKIRHVFSFPGTPARKIHHVFSFPDTPARKIRHVFSFPDTLARKIRHVFGKKGEFFSKSSVAGYATGSLPIRKSFTFTCITKFYMI